MKFSDLSLSGKTLKAINACGYSQPTEVQKKAIPKIIAGKNLVVRSQTGTGKTAAFGIGIVERIVTGSTSKALILVPTRELAMQVSKELQELGQRHKLNTCAVYGGQKVPIQLRKLQDGYTILVATPGRLQDLCKRRKVHLSRFDLIVLDEADHMLDIGFQKEVLEILSHLPSKRVTLLFSATIDKGIEGIISRHMLNSEYIEIGEKKIVSTINEEHIELSHVDKTSEIHRILDSHRGVKTLIFMRTKRGVIRLKEKLRRRKIDGVGMLQGDMDQSRRSRVIDRFKDGEVTILVATNVAARGLHIENVGLIINFDKAENKETHLHRVGRTGRMGQSGPVINLIAHDEPKRGRGGRRPEGRSRTDSGSRRPRSRGRKPSSADGSRESGSGRGEHKSLSRESPSRRRSSRNSRSRAQDSYEREPSRRRPSNRGDYGGHDDSQRDSSRRRPSKRGEQGDYSGRSYGKPAKHKKGKRGAREGPERSPRESSHNNPRSRASRRHRR